MGFSGFGGFGGGGLRGLFSGCSVGFLSLKQP